MTRTLPTTAKSTSQKSNAPADKVADPRRATTVKARPASARPTTVAKSTDHKKSVSVQKTTSSSLSRGRRPSKVRRNIEHAAPTPTLNETVGHFNQAKALLHDAVSSLDPSVKVDALANALIVMQVAIDRVTNAVAEHTVKLGAEAAFPPDVIDAYVALGINGRRHVDDLARTLHGRQMGETAPTVGPRGHTESTEPVSTHELRRSRRRTRTQGAFASIEASDVAQRLSALVGRENDEHPSTAKKK